MKLAKKLEKEIMEAYHKYWNAYLEGDMRTMASCMDENCQVIGSGRGEVFQNRKEAIKYYSATADQISGKSDIKNRKITLQPAGNHILVTEESDFFVLLDGNWTFYAAGRISTHFAHLAGHWLIIQQHGSLPDGRTGGGEQINTDQIREENIRLKEAVKRRTIELERKNRELEIETAVERVRAEAMAMHSTSDFEKVTRQLLTQVKKLNLEGFTGSSICIIDENQMMTWWDFSSPGNIADQTSQFIRYDGKKYQILGRDVLKKWQEGESYMVFDYDLEQLHAAIKEWEEINTEVANAFKEAISKGKLTHQWNPCGRLSNGLLAFDMVKPPDDDVRKITIKMAHAFEQAYTRFLDLQKAEAQAREAQIEVALERVRAQVNRMEKSEDLLDVVVAMRQEFVSLGYEAHYFWHMRWLPETYQKAMTSGDGTRIGMVMELPRRIHGEIKVLAEWEKSDEPTVIFPMDVEAALDYVHKMGAWGDFERIDPNMPSDDDIRHIGGLTYIMARTSLGEIGYSLPGVVASVPQENLDILIRFARAFDLAHKRFEDLKISEQQARETKIELALEKVRSRTMAMQRSNELPEAANLLFLQVQALGIPAWSAGYCIWENEDNTSATAFMSSEGVLQKPFSLPTAGQGYNFYDPLQNGETFHIEELGGEEIVKHYEFMRTLPVFGEVIDGIMEAGFPLPTFQIFHIVFFPQGYLMFITYEQVPDAHDIFIRFAKVFEQTYTRFLDLQKSEEQAGLIKQEKERLEKTLNELQTTQKQLIHAEKMASLGELTAGIAHEIKNPLNFVNNFSEVSGELLDDMVEEMQKGETDEVFEIIGDLKNNLQKIVEHGQRADSIVKGMLQHSRTNTGEKLPTNINALADEYLRLAYHGYRAKDKSFNAIFETDFDETLEKMMVVPQDIGRVFLNLISNAFHAVRERSLQSDDQGDYEPTVIVKTQKQNQNVLIEIIDNGPGMSNEIRNKIFQPFFTTKPTGEGTGLGLSMSFDIIKLHRGKISVDTKEGEGTTFRIILPNIHPK